MRKMLEMDVTLYVPDDVDDERIEELLTSLHYENLAEAIRGALADNVGGETVDGIPFAVRVEEGTYLLGETEAVA